MYELCTTSGHLGHWCRMAPARAGLPMNNESAAHLGGALYKPQHPFPPRC